MFFRFAVCGADEDGEGLRGVLVWEGRRRAGRGRRRGGGGVIRCYCEAVQCLIGAFGKGVAGTAFLGEVDGAVGGGAAAVKEGG